MFDHGEMQVALTVLYPGSVFSFIQKSWFISMWFQVLNGL